MKRRLLMITHDFAPNGITSSRRPGGMAKYLPEFGWEPTVLTRKWRPGNCNYDPTVVPNLPESLIRCEMDYPEPTGLSPRAFVEQAVRFTNPALHPYSFVRAGRRTIDRLLQSETFDAVWTTVPANNLLDLAHYASHRSGKPWIADFRDVWQWVPNMFTKLTLSMRIEHERRRVAQATAITAVSKGFAETLSERHGRDVHTISHGFDPDLLPRELPRRFPRFNIVYTGGIILGSPNLRPLLDAIGGLIQRQEMNPADVTIDFFGRGNTARLGEMFAGHPYSRLVKDHGVVSREQVVEHQRRAAILLIASHPGMRGWITSKMFEYIIAGRPILSIPRDHDCIDEMLSETQAGVSCSSVAEIEHQLRAFYLEWKQTGAVSFMGRMDVIGQYSNRPQAGQLAQLLDGIVSRS